MMSDEKEFKGILRKMDDSGFKPLPRGSIKKFGIVLTPEQEDEIHNATWKVLENVSTGNYRHHH